MSRIMWRTLSFLSPLIIPTWQVTNSFDLILEGKSDDRFSLLLPPLFKSNRICVCIIVAKIRTTRFYKPIHSILWSHFHKSHECRNFFYLLLLWWMSFTTLHAKHIFILLFVWTCHVKHHFNCFSLLAAIAVLKHLNWKYWNWRRNFEVAIMKLKLRS